MTPSTHTGMLDGDGPRKLMSDRRDECSITNYASISLSSLATTRCAHAKKHSSCLQSLLLFAGRIASAFFSALKGFACSETWLNNYRETFAAFRRLFFAKNGLSPNFFPFLTICRMSRRRFFAGSRTSRTEKIGVNPARHSELTRLNTVLLSLPTNGFVRAIVSAVLLLMAGGITRLHLIENRRELDSAEDNGAFLLPRWPGTIDKLDSLRPDSDQDFSFLHPVRKCQLRVILPRYFNWRSFVCAKVLILTQLGEISIS